jgi:hypothetical protein
MERRGFLKFLGAGVAGIALEQAIPFGRVWSFPSTITRWLGADPAGVTEQAFTVTHVGNNFLNVEWVTAETLAVLKRNLKFNAHVMAPFANQFAVGDTISVRIPQRFIPEGRLRRLP